MEGENETQAAPEQEADHDWEFEVGELITDDEEFIPEVDGVGKTVGSVYEVKRRLVDPDNEKEFYYVEEETKNSINTHLKNAKMVHSLFKHAGWSEEAEKGDDG